MLPKYGSGVVKSVSPDKSKEVMAVRSEKDLGMDPVRLPSTLEKSNFLHTKRDCIVTGGRSSQLREVSVNMKSHKQARVRVSHVRFDYPSGRQWPAGGPAVALAESAPSVTPCEDGTHVMSHLVESSALSAQVT